MQTTQVKAILKVTALIFTAAACCMLYAGSCYSAEKYVRVAILQDAELIRVSVNGPYNIIDARDGKILSSGKFLSAAASGSKAGIIIDGDEYKTGRISVEASGQQPVVINGRNYRGNVRLIKKDNLRLTAVNDIGLEDYVKGILYNEVSHYWPEEALKAQAVVCRTYAIYQSAQSSGRDYDVTNDIYSQVYGGKASERFRTNRAVDDTKGLTLTYAGAVFPAYFHATCGGHTEDASLLWNINLPVLWGVSCGFCKESPHFNWHRVMTLDEIKDALVKAGHKNCGNILAIEISGTDNSGRVRDLVFRTDKDMLVVSAKDFRNIIGPNAIKSANFKVSITGRDAIFEGRGWGHGAGMCQWGAYFMAKEARSFKDILAHYYPGSELSQY
ncbi:MAG: SpoIID/LytB domain-containing protein [Candidatus Omnitrophota bacterium]